MTPGITVEWGFRNTAFFFQDLGLRFLLAWLPWSV